MRYARRTLPTVPSEARLTPIRPYIAIEQLETALAQYLYEERGLCRGTVEQYLREIRRFVLDRFGDGPIMFQKMHDGDVANFVVIRAGTVSASTAKHSVTALRTLFRFLHQRGDTVTNLGLSLPTVPHWTLTGLPKYISSEEVELVLQTSQPDRVEGHRDRAILLLLARLGLRAGEVSQLTLDDIDWNAGEVVIRGKGGRLDRMPMSKEVGKALARYLRYSRPKCSSRNVFIRLRAPYRGFTGSDAIGRVVRSALHRAGLNPAHKGAHVLRHSLATRLLRSGCTLPEIGQVLRHQLPKTTAIYAKVDLASLRAIAWPWPGGEA